MLTLKPIIYVGNVEEELVANPEASLYFKKLKEEANKQNANSLGISAKIEGELAQLECEDQEMFLTDLKISETGLNRIIRSSFKLLNLSTYFTAGPKEVRAWTFKNGMTAPQCAGIIHTDFERGFIKAEVIKYKDFVECDGEQSAKAVGKYRLEGKEYIFQDGDIVNFKFNV